MDNTDWYGLHSKYIALFSDNVPFILAITIPSIIVLLIILKIWRTGRRRSSGSGLGMGFENLDRLKKAGGLTPEEVKKIRQAIVRQTMKNEPEERVTVADLEMEALALADLPKSPKPKQDPVAEESSDRESLIDQIKSGKINADELDEIKRILEDREKNN